MKKSANAYSDAFLQEMRDKLQAEKDRLTTSLSRFAKKNVSASEEDYDARFPEYGDDEDENAVEIAEYSNNLSLEQELEKELRDVESSLERLDKGTYGIDKYTGEPIGEDRLRARPTSTSSVASKKTLTQEM